MMTLLTSISKSGAETVPMARSTDAIGTVLRHAFGHPALPDNMKTLLRRIDQRTGH